VFINFTSVCECFFKSKVRFRLTLSWLLFTSCYRDIMTIKRHGTVAIFENGQQVHCMHVNAVVMWCPQLLLWTNFERKTLFAILAALTPAQWLGTTETPLFTTGTQLITTGTPLVMTGLSSSPLVTTGKPSCKQLGKLEYHWYYWNWKHPWNADGVRYHLFTTGYHWLPLGFRHWLPLVPHWLPLIYHWLPLGLRHWLPRIKLF
jgi:hypothetical protein